MRFEIKGRLPATDIERDFIVFAKFSYDELDTFNPVTICSLEIQLNDEPYGGLEGYNNVTEVICDTRDRFVKDIGRKLSLRKAMQSLPMAFRTAIWKAYLGRKKNG